MDSSIINLDSVDKYNRLFGLETLHPLVSVVDLSQASKSPTRSASYTYKKRNKKTTDIRRTAKRPPHQAMAFCHVLFYYFNNSYTEATVSFHSAAVSPSAAIAPRPASHWRFTEAGDVPLYVLRWFTHVSMSRKW